VSLWVARPRRKDNIASSVMVVVDRSGSDQLVTG